MSAVKINRSVKAVFFDAVGTLLLPAEPVALTYRAAAQRHGAAIEPAVITDRLREAFAKQERFDREAGWRTSESREVARWRTIVRETLREADDPEACFFELWEWYRSPTSWVLAADTGAVLSALAGRGLILGMASNFDARLIEVMNGKSELAPLADRCVISSFAGWRKPAGEFYAEVARQANLPANQILYVGDDLRNDVEGARQAGLQALLFDPARKSIATDLIAALIELL